MKGRDSRGRFVRGHVGYKSLLGIKRSENTKKKLSKALKGRHLSPQTEFKKGHPYGRRFKRGVIPWNKQQIKVNCSHCGKELIRPKHRVKKNKNHFCNKNCQSKWLIGNFLPWNKGKHGIYSKEHIRKLIISHKDKDVSHLHTEKVRKKISKVLRKYWKDPKFIDKMVKAYNFKPNKPEILLEQIINQLTSDFKYNGDFSQGIAIGGKIPDFVNCNGKKQVIEMFGNFWHDPKRRKVKLNQTYDGTIRHYKKYGWNCLIIWEKELKDMGVVREKIEKFLV